MPPETFAYDSAEHLKTPEHIAADLDAVLEDNDSALLAHAVGLVARAGGLAQIAGPLQLDTLMSVLRVLGLRLSVQPIEA